MLEYRHARKTGNHLQQAVDAAGSGDTICVYPGTYEEEVSVDEPDVTIRGQSAADWGAINGIQIFGGGPDRMNIEVRGNTVTDFLNEKTDPPGGAAGIKLQADLDGVTVTGNRVSDLHSAGWAWGVVLTSSDSHPDVPKDVVVDRNTMERLNDGSEFDVFSGPNRGRDAAPFPGGAFGVDGEAEADEVTSLTRNNLLAPNGAENKDGDDTLVAECNWWGDSSGPTHDDNPGGDGTWAYENPGDIDPDPWLNSPAPSSSCIGGSGPGL